MSKELSSNTLSAIQAYKGQVTKCLPVVAQGSGASRATKQAVTKRRAQLRREARQ